MFLPLTVGGGIRAVEDMRRLLLAGDAPVVLDDIWLNARLFKGLTAERLQAYRGPMYGLFESEFGVQMIRAEEKIRAIAAAEADARIMEAEARVRIEETLARRQALAERRIASAEAQASAEVKAAAADVAAQAAETILAARLATQTSDPLLDAAIGQIGTRLN